MRSDPPDEHGGALEPHQSFVSHEPRTRWFPGLDGPDVWLSVALAA
ncbi:Hypothetical protein A7982_04234 [Minicystis rosea]|nr:Hypothetical protein A7982_04234 [Minicystis rosea]